MTGLNINQLHPFAVGFDRMFDRLFDDSFVTTTNYPPYNIVKLDESNYAIQIAIAGFGKDDIEIETKENILAVRTKDKDESEVVDDTTYLHKGISNRAFKRTWQISDDVVVKGATFENGLLNIELERIIPEEKKPRLIKIK